MDRNINRVARTTCCPGAKHGKHRIVFLPCGHRQRVAGVAPYAVVVEKSGHVG